MLNPYLAARDVHCQPIIAPTKTTATGTFKGGAPWREYEKLTRNLLQQPHWHRVGILTDFYGRPQDLPGTRVDRHGPAYRDELVAQMTAVFDSPRVLPHLILHEFETVVLAAIDAGATAIPAAAQTALMQQIAEAGGDVEAVNDSPQTSPSHRITAAWPGYTKTIDGIRLIDEVGIEATMARCPTFAAWVEALTV